ncbi:chitin deacetylase [Nowakowskiella sp. JEL0078]|nr:chitin deacetylase [Nowakowskiella sp. JEL0078]
MVNINLAPASLRSIPFFIQSMDDSFLHSEIVFEVSEGVLIIDSMKIHVCKVGMHEILSFAIGDGVGCVLSTSGKLFVFQFEQVGDPVSTPIEIHVNSPMSMKFVDVVGGSRHFVALSESGTVVSFGDGLAGQLGHGTIKKSYDWQSGCAEVIEALDGIRVCKIAAGFRHTALLTEFGDIYTFGSNVDGQLGLAILENSNLNTTLPNLSSIELCDDSDPNNIGKKIKACNLCCGGHFTMCSKSGKVYMAGKFIPYEGSVDFFGKLFTMNDGSEEWKQIMDFGDDSIVEFYPGFWHVIFASRAVGDVGTIPTMPTSWPSIDQSIMISGAYLTDPIVVNAMKIVNASVPAELLNIPVSTYISGSEVTYKGTAASTCYWPSNLCVRSTAGTGYIEDVYTCPSAGQWGISYDDGPTSNTAALRNLLDSMSLKATFFVAGANAYQLPNEVALHDKSGHHVAVHTWTHHPLTSLTNEQIVAEIKYTEAIIYQAIGKVSTYMRPPYGDVDDRVRAIVNALGYRVVLWDKDSDDASGASTVTSTIQSWFTSTAGFVSLEHDISSITTNFATQALTAIKNLGSSFKLSIQPIATCNGHNPYSYPVSSESKSSSSLDPASTSSTIKVSVSTTTTTTTTTAISTATVTVSSYSLSSSQNSKAQITSTITVTQNKVQSSAKKTFAGMTVFIFTAMILSLLF